MQTILFDEIVMVRTIASCLIVLAVLITCFDRAFAAELDDAYYHTGELAGSSSNRNPISEFPKEPTTTSKNR